MSSTIAPFSGVELKDITLGAVSVAGSGKLRQIINLADGTEPTDAVNLRHCELWAVQWKPIPATS